MTLCDVTWILFRIIILKVIRCTYAGLPSIRIGIRDSYIAIPFIVHIPIVSVGVKSLKILPLEPLLINTVKIGNSGGSVSLEQEYYNMKLHGLTKGPRINSFQYVCKVIWNYRSNNTKKKALRRSRINVTFFSFPRFDWDKLILISEAHNPLVELIADYKLKGNILLLPLRGNGKCNISLRKYRGIFVWVLIIFIHSFSMF